MAKVVPIVKNQEKGTHWELLELLMRMRQNSNSVHLLYF